MHLVPFERGNKQHLRAFVKIWNAACGPDLAINLRLAEYNTQLATGAKQAGQVAFIADQAFGFVLASALVSDPQTSPPQVGWIDAIAVDPNSQRRGIGRGLLAWAEGWLREQGCSRARLGGSLRPFVPGLPVELAKSSYFEKSGYTNDRSVWDVARDLSNYPISGGVDLPNLTPAKSDNAESLLEFLRREFPGRWRFEFEEFLRARGQMPDYFLLRTPRSIDGFARLTFESSERPIERYYMQRLPRPWGQLGPIGVSKDLRGRGLGRALLDGALNYLRERGVRGCLIDWTDLVDLYTKFGFAPYREYAVLRKELTPDEFPRN